MATQPFTVEQFGGLNARDDPFEIGVGASVDMANVDLDRRGRVRTRDGYARIVAVTNTNSRYESLVSYDGASGNQLIVGYENSGTPTLSAYTSTGVLIDSVVTSVFGFPFLTAARGAVAGSQYLYVTDGFGAFQRWNGSTFSAPAGMPAVAYISQVPTSGRLAGGSYGGNLSQVLFSDPFQAETWDLSNYVDLAPGDGSITAVTSWRDKLFVFKQRQFFVFTGESTDAGGGPIFNYYTVDRHGGYTACAGDEGVYFWDGRSIWLTTGDAPTLVSSMVDLVLRGETSINGETVALATTVDHRLSYAAGRLYVSIAMTGGARRTLVFDPQLGSWMFWTVSVCAANVLGAPVSTYFLSVAGIEKLGASTSDNGTSITWAYKSGRYGLADAGTVAVTPATSVVGSGTVALRLDSDLYSNQNGSATLGTAPATAEGWPDAVDQEGTWLQYTLSGTGAATVSRLTHFVGSVKPVAVR